jgi:hypothetical protein
MWRPTRQKPGRHLPSDEELTVKTSMIACFFGCLAASAVTLTAQTPPASGTPAAQIAEMPAEYKQVLDALGKQGDFKDGVLKVNIPRSDLKVVVDGIATPTPFGFGGWVALEKGTGGMNVMMGDLVLTDAEVNPVMSALLDNGLDVTAVHNHFFFESPRIFYMHVHGHGAAADLASKLKPALALIGKNPAPAGAVANRSMGRSTRRGSPLPLARPARRTPASTKSPSVGRTSNWKKWARPSTRAWDSTRGRRSMAATLMPWWPETSPCSTVRCSLS